ncbi:hypothetical protein GCM10010319_21650 [Streptomyces blastmyceticus]|uniref:Uncharacterized protein n=1 Tax=Streptomyces blastmyceticus TaxID=68180 RepID=A0ABN0WRT1_9ACTN
MRLSVLTDETTSPERQREADDLAAAALGIDFDGREAVDLDVSASKVGPFDPKEATRAAAMAALETYRRGM